MKLLLLISAALLSMKASYSLRFKLQSLIRRKSFSSKSSNLPSSSSSSSSLSSSLSSVPAMPSYYNYIDSGDLKRLEKFGDKLIIRPCPSAIWKQSSAPSIVSQWKNAEIIYEKSIQQQQQGPGGVWKYKNNDKNEDNNAIEKFPQTVSFSVSLENNGNDTADVGSLSKEITFTLAPSAEGQIGVFPEQRENWKWLNNIVTTELSYRLSSKMAKISQNGNGKNGKRNGNASDNDNGVIKVLNGFAYTGGSTLAVASALKSIPMITSSPVSPSSSETGVGGVVGGDKHISDVKDSLVNISIVHLDAAKSSVQWAMENSKASGIPSSCIRFIEDDCITFCEREIRRGNKYDGLIFDPPAFGRAGKGKKVWKLEKDLEKLVSLFPLLLSDDASFILLSCHDVDWPAYRLATLLSSTMSSSSSSSSSLSLSSKWKIEVGEMKLSSSPNSDVTGNPLPLGNYVRWSRKRITKNN